MYRTICLILAVFGIYLGCDNPSAPAPSTEPRKLEVVAVETPFDPMPLCQEVAKKLGGECAEELRLKPKLSYGTVHKDVAIKQKVSEYEPIMLTFYVYDTSETAVRHLREMSKEDEVTFPGTEAGYRINQRLHLLMYGNLDKGSKVHAAQWTEAVRIFEDQLGKE